MKIKVLYEKRALVLFDSHDGDKIHVEKRFLVLGDLHIGFEDRFEAGVQLHSNSSLMASEIAGLIDQESITDVVLNGDIKSGIDRISKAEWDNVPKLLSSLSEKSIVHIVPGNHDGGISNLTPERVEILDASGYFVSGNLILHGNTLPAPKYSSCSRIIMGHVHPIFKRRGSPLSGNPVWVFLKISRKTIFKEAPSDVDDLLEVILMPSFNLDLFIAGYSFDAASEERRVAPLVRDLRKAADAVVVTLNGEVIGDSSILDAIL